MAGSAGKSVDEYLANLPPDRRAEVTQVHDVVNRTMPKGYERDTARLALKPRRVWLWSEIQGKATVKFKAAGMPRKEIAKEMKVSVRTVQRYLRAVRT